jgi:hypothetical protein
MKFTGTLSPTFTNPRVHVRRWYEANVDDNEDDDDDDGADDDVGVNDRGSWW